jgi:hypothetical protein
MAVRRPRNVNAATPLDVLLEAMDVAFDRAKNGKGSWETAVNFATAAAPYVHSKIAASPAPKPGDRVKVTIVNEFPHANVKEDQHVVS